MEFQRYLNMFRRWVWLLILGVVLGALGGGIASALQQPVYEAKTRFVILRAAQTSTDSYSYLDSQQLIKTYIQLLTTSNLMDTVSQQIGYPVDAKQASATQILDTQFVELTVTDTDPSRAALIANVLVTSLIKQNEELQAVRYVTAERNLQTQADQVQTQISTLQTQINDISSATVQDQLTQVKTQIDDLQKQITELQTSINDLSALATISDAQKVELADKQASLDQLQPVLVLYQQVYTNLVVLGQPVEGSNSSTQLSQLQTTLGLYQQIYISLLNSLENVRLAKAQNTPNVVQVEPATVPEDPIRPQPLRNTLLAAVVGLMLAAGIAFLVEYLDDTLKTPEDVEHDLNLHVLGLIADMEMNGSKNKEANPGKLFTAEHPRSPISEAFRTLRTNLEFSGIDRPLRIILVTSTGPGEGKSTVAANLAFILSQSDKRVILLDADLRRPSLHRYFDIPNRIGISHVLRGKLNIPEVLNQWKTYKNLQIITSGSLPPNPTELLGSEKMASILDELAGMADFVVIDTPPMLLADAQVLSSHVDGVLFIVQPGTTHTDSARTTVEQLTRANARMLGVVMNRIPRNRAYYYGGYRHYSPYYYYNKKYKYSAYASEEASKGESASD